LDALEKIAQAIVNSVLFVASDTPIQETLHITKYHSPLAGVLLIAQLVLSLLPIALVVVAMVFLRCSRKTRQTLRLLLLSILWLLLALIGHTMPWGWVVLFWRLNLQMYFGIATGIGLAAQFLFLFFAIDLIALFRNDFYGVTE